jgi:peptide deformylase
MIIKNATQVGNPVIRKKAPRVTDFKSKETKQTVRDLIDSMRDIHESR